jgi:predicted permease
VRLQALSGVQSAAFVRVAPFSYRGYSSASIAVDGYEAPPDEAPVIDYDEIGPGALSVLGVPLVSGREFTRADDERSEPVAVVNEAMAAQYWRGQDPVNRRLQVKGRSMRVVGVARQAKYENLLEPKRSFFYVPLRQSVLGLGLVMRTGIRPDAMATALMREIHALDANLSPGEVITMREQVARTTSSQTMAVRLLTVFGTLALLLAAIGLYGVMSSAVSQSTREFGLRLALGATASDLLRLVLSRGLALSAAGVVVGVGAAIQLTRLLGNLLFEVSPRDPAVFGLAFLVMATMSAVACVVPAWRATRIDPLLALRG